MPRTCSNELAESIDSLRHGLEGTHLGDVDGFEAHQVGQLVDDDLALDAGPLVDALDASVLPVGPVQVVAEQRETEDVRHTLAEDLAPVAAVHVGHLDLVRFGVAPVQPPFCAAHTQTPPVNIQSMYQH